MKYILLFSLCLLLTASAYTGFAQTLPNDYLREMQRADPVAAAALSRAVQQGDFEAAQKMYQDFLKKQERGRYVMPSTLPAKQPAKPSLLERTLSADVPPALSALDKGGTLALAGIHMTDIPEMDYETHLFYERNVHSVTANTRDDGRELLAEAAEIPIRPHVTTYPLAEANRALQDLKADCINGTGVLVMENV